MGKDKKNPKGSSSLSKTIADGHYKKDQRSQAWPQFQCHDRTFLSHWVFSLTESPSVHSWDSTASARTGRSCKRTSLRQPCTPHPPAGLTTLVVSAVFLGTLIRSHFLFAVGLLSRMFFFTTLRSLFLPGMYPCFKEMRIGSAFFPSNHSSASSAASGPAVSGYRSSWKRSDYKRHFGENLN